LVGSTPLALLAAQRYVRWLYKSTYVVPEFVNSEMQEQINDIDTDDFSPEELMSGMPSNEWSGSTPPHPTHLTRRRRTQRLASAIARECRTKFAFVAKSEADVLVAHKWIYDRVSALKDIRTTDVNLIVPLAVKLAFIPSVDDIVREMYAAPHVDRMQLAAATWVQRRSWTQWMVGHNNARLEVERLSRD
jgi:hypothetical protein